MKTYKPHKYQKLFHDSDTRFRTFVAGRRGGKSLAGTIEALKQADRKPTNGMIVAPTYGMLMDVNVAMIMDWCPAGAIKSWNKVEKNLELINGSTITFRSGDNPDRLRGTEKDWIWMDEACFMGRYVWDVIYPVLTSTNGIAWVTTTPQGYDWVYDTFYKPAIDGDKDYEAWRFSTFDNPAIDKDLIEKAKSDMSEVMFRQEYMASFEKFEGLIYPDFNESIHTLIPRQHELTDNYFVGLDVGWNHPTACILIREDKDRNIFVMDEFKESFLTVDTIGNNITSMLARNGLTADKIEMFIIDPASRGTQQSSGQSMLGQLQQEGWPFVPGVNDVMAGINRVTRLLKEDRIFIHKKCEKIIYEFNNYHWRKWDDDKDNDRAKPFKLGDDLMDAFRYVIMSRPDWFEHKKADIYGREVIDGADPITGVVLDRGTEAMQMESEIDSMMGSSSIDDMM